MRVQRTVDVVSARHHARVLVRQAVVLQTRSARTQKSNLFFYLICWYNYYVLVKKKGCRMTAFFFSDQSLAGWKLSSSNFKKNKRLLSLRNLRILSSLNVPHFVKPKCLIISLVSELPDSLMIKP